MMAHSAPGHGPLWTAARSAVNDSRPGVTVQHASHSLCRLDFKRGRLQGRRGAAGKPVNRDVPRTWEGFSGTKGTWMQWWSPGRESS
eukprot:3941432-Rhodomonas_salina.4